MIQHSTTTASRLPMAVLMMLLCACGASYTDSELVQRAREFRAQGEQQAAIIELKNAALKNPANAEARWLLAQLRLETGDPAAAEKEINRAIELGLPERQGQPALVQALLLQGKNDEVLAQGLTLAEGLDDSNRALVLAVVGQAFTAAGDFDKASLAFDQALETDPNSQEALLGQAAAFGRQRQFEQARQMNLRAMAVDDSSVEAWSQLGQIELDLGRYEEAEAAFSRAIDLSNYPRIDLARRAWTRMLQNNYEGAEQDLQKAREKGFDRHPYINYLQGIVRIRQQNYAEAEVLFGDVVTVMPDHLPSKVYLATALLAQKEYEQARTLAEQISREAPSASASLLGGVFASQSDYAAASAALESSLTGGATDETALGLLGSLALAQGDAAAGTEYFQQVAALNPESKRNNERLMVAKIMNGEDIGDEAIGAGYEAEFLYAVNLFQKRELSKALALAERLHETHPTKTDPLNLVAGCYLLAADWINARPALEKVLQLDPENSSAVRNLAKVELAEDNGPAARELLKQYLSKNPQDTEAIVLLSEVEHHLGDPKSADQVLLAARSTYPEDAYVLLALARRSFDQGELVKTSKILADVSDSMATQQPQLLEIKGKSEARTAQFDAAESSFRRWVGVSPNDAKAHYYLGDVLLRGNKPDKALQEFKVSSKIDPAFILPKLGAAQVYLRQQEVAQAESTVAELHRQFPEAAETLWLDGWLALLKGDLPRAEESLSSADQFLNDSELTLLLSTALLQQEKTEKALAVLRLRLEENPGDPTVLQALAGTLQGLGKNQEAVAVYAEIVERYPQNVLSLNNLAALTGETDPQLALSYAERAYKLMPQNPYVLDTLGTLLMDSDSDLQRAIALLTQATTNAPDNPDFQLHLGQLLLKSGNKEDAANALNQVIALSPDSAAASKAKQLLVGL